MSRAPGPPRATAESRRAAHTAVLRAAAIEALDIRPSGTYLDGTFGRGGHAREMLSRLDDAGRLLLMDKDPEAIAVAREEFGADPRVAIRHGSFAVLAEWTATAAGLDGALFDLGVSSPQLDQGERGFSFGHDGPLDMRMDTSAEPSAAQWLQGATEAQIADALWQFGEERHSRRIARAIVAARLEKPLTRTAELAELVARNAGKREKGKHPATRTFQALRIVVNRELEDLASGLAQAVERLLPGGRLVVISFHSLEDRLVKHFLRDESQPPRSGRRGLPLPMATSASRLRLVGAAIKPSAEEIAGNVRARSAVMRVAERLPVEAAA